jgi:Flp pilus assembly protein TadG
VVTEFLEAMSNCFPPNWYSHKRLPLRPGPVLPISPRRYFPAGAGKRRRGAAAAEFAIVAPVFFLMVIGFIEFGRALMVQQVLINASRVGARQATTAGATTSQVQAAVQAYTSGVAVNGVVVTVSPDPSTAVAGSTITVNASVAFSNVSWMKSAWFLGGKTLKASSQMRKEGFD